MGQATRVTQVITAPEPLTTHTAQELGDKAKENTDIHAELGRVHAKPVDAGEAPGGVGESKLTSTSLGGAATALLPIIRAAIDSAGAKPAFKMNPNATAFVPAASKLASA